MTYLMMTKNPSARYPRCNDKPASDLQIYDKLISHRMKMSNGKFFQSLMLKCYRSSCTVQCLLV